MASTLYPITYCILYLYLTFYICGLQPLSLSILQHLLYILGILNRLISDCKNAQPPLILLSLSTYITILIISSLFYTPDLTIRSFTQGSYFCNFLYISLLYLWLSSSTPLHNATCTYISLYRCGCVCTPLHTATYTVYTRCIE